jgi:hypothetical protein
MYCCFLCTPSRHTGTDEVQLYSPLISTLDGSEWAKIEFREKYDVNMQAHAQSSTKSTLKMRYLLWHKCTAGIYIYRSDCHKILGRRYKYDKLSRRGYRSQENADPLAKKWSAIAEDNAISTVCCVYIHQKRWVGNKWRSFKCEIYRNCYTYGNETKYTVFLTCHSYGLVHSCAQRYSIRQCPKNGCLPLVTDASVSRIHIVFDYHLSDMLH